MEKNFDQKKFKQKNNWLTLLCIAGFVVGLTSIICAFTVGAKINFDYISESLDKVVTTGDVESLTEDPKDYYGTYYVKAKGRYLTFELSESGCVFTSSNGMTSTVENYQYGYVSAKYLSSRLEGYDYDDPAILVYLEGKPSLIESSKAIVMRIISKNPYVFSVEGGTTNDKPIDFSQDMGDPKDYYGIFKYSNIYLTLNVDYTFLLNDGTNRYSGKYAYVTDEWLNKNLRGNYDLKNGALALLTESDGSYYVFEYNGSSTLTFNNKKYIKEKSFSADVGTNDQTTYPTPADPEIQDPTPTTPDPVQTEDDYNKYLKFSYSYEYGGYCVTGYEGAPEKIVVPENYNNSKVKCIKTNAFENCTSLKEIVIPDSVTIIEKYVFKGCSALESITLPFVGNIYYDDEEAMKFIEDDTFVIDESLTVFGSLFSNVYFDNSKLEKQIDYNISLINYYIPASLKIVRITSKIGVLAFANINIDFDLILEDSITDISVMAFLSATCDSFIMPESVDYISHGCFAVSTINDLYLHSKIKSIGTIVFGSNLNVHYDGTKNDWLSLNKDEEWQGDSEVITVICTDGIINY